jgi:hypothetical protein
MVLQIVSTLVELIQLRRTLVSDKELEILLLRRQLAIYKRKQRQLMRLTREKKLTLVVLAIRLKATTGRTIKQLGEQLMTHYKDQLLACNFFTIDTLFLQTLCIDSHRTGSRRVPFVGCTAHPDKAWSTQQARQVMWALDEREPAIRFLIRDNDKKFSHAFDTVFRSAGIEVIPTPCCAPNTNAFAERWIRSVREECLDKLLILDQAHLRRVMREYITFFNTARPHQGIGQQILVLPASRATSGPVRCRKVLGGILHDYYRDVAQARIGVSVRFFGPTPWPVTWLG